MKRTFSVSASATLVAVAALAGLAAAGSPAGAANNAADNGRVKNVIYLVGDGMGRTHVTAGRERFYGADGKLNMEKLPAHGYVSTYSVEKTPASPGRKDSARTTSRTPHHLPPRGHPASRPTTPHWAWTPRGPPSRPR